MPDASSYILSFDFTDLITEIGDVTGAYTDFGKTIRESVDGVKTDIESLKGQLEGVQDTTLQTSMIIGNMYESQHIGMVGVLADLDKFSEKSKEIAANFEKISGIDLSSLKDLGAAGTGKDTIAGRIGDIDPGAAAALREQATEGISDEAAQAALDKAKEAVSTAKKALGEVEKSEEKIQGTIKRTVAYVRKEIEEGKKSMVGTLKGAIPGGVGAGGILTGLVAMMALGVGEEARKAAERGEMINVFEGLSGEGFMKAGRRAGKVFADFAENAQRQLGIGRKEVQTMAKEFVDAGYTGEQMLKSYGQTFDEVGTVNIPTATLALDKYFNMAAGTSAKKVNDLVAQYGDSLGEAARKQIVIGMAAQQSGMGISKFIDSVYAGSQSLVQYGIDVEDVAASMGALQKHYEAMGLDKQYAGELAARGVKGVAAGIGGAGEGMKAVLAREMYGGQGKDYFEIIQEFEEGFRNIAKGDKDVFDKMVRSLGTVMDQMVGPEASKRFAWLRKMGFSSDAASSAIAMVEKQLQGKPLEKASKEQIAAFKKAFAMEGTQLSALQQAQNKLIDGMANIGKGIMKILAGIFGTLLMGLKAIPAFIAGVMDPTNRDKIFANISKNMEGQWNFLAGGLQDVGKGFKDIGEAGKASEMEKMLGVLKKAWTADLTEGAPSLTDRALGAAQPISDFATKDVFDYPAAFTNALISGRAFQDELQTIRDGQRDRDLAFKERLDSIVNWIKQDVLLVDQPDKRTISEGPLGPTKPRQPATPPTGAAAPGVPGAPRVVLVKGEIPGDKLKQSINSRPEVK